MFYFEVITNTILSLFLSIKILVLLFIFCFLLYLSWNNIKNTNTKFNFLIIFIRFFIFLLILPIFENKNFKFEKNKIEKQNIGIFIDNSKSIKENYTIKEIYSVIDSIYIWATNNNLNLYLYDLDSSITKDRLLLNKNLTSFNAISRFSISDNLNQLIIISDGNINSGYSFNNLKFSNDIIIHTIGLGPIHNINKIKIVNTEILSYSDSTIANIKININSIIDNQKAVLTVYSDNYKNSIYLDTILIKKGNYFFDEKIIFNELILDDKLIFDISLFNSLNEEKPKDSWVINFDDIKKEKVLLLTGSPNYNTSFLKEILTNNLKLDFIHHVFLNNDYSELELNNIDCIIFDNFPTSEYQLDIVKKIKLLNIPIIFIEGNNSQTYYIDLLFSLFYDENFYIEQEVKNKKLLINDIDIWPVYSNYDLFLDDKNNFSQVTYFSNNSVSSIIDDQFSLILIPNISEIDFYFKNKYNQDYLSEYISFLIKKQINNNLINLKLNKNNYLKGEKISFLLNDALPFDSLSKTLILYNIFEKRTDSILYLGQDIFINEKGEYQAYFLYKGTNGNIMNSNNVSFSVSDEIFELKKTSQNKSFLNKVSKEFNGNYIDINNFDYNYFSNFKVSPNYKKYDYILSALDLFISEKIYLLVIILFSLEIYLRKRIGLL
tara:strand:+ start:343 stop:2328 length:1986 start_codon:yes stop_codon:yes gene_type:complete